MKLKLFMISGVYALCMVALSLLVLIALHRFGIIEREEVVEDVLQVQNMLQSEISQLLTTAGDYAGWDDTYNYVKDLNAAYLEHSLGNSFYSKLRLNLFCISRLDGTVIHARYGRAENSVHHHLPDDLKAALSSENMLFQAALQQKPTGGIVALADGLLMLAAQPVVTSEFQGPVRGMLVLGRFLSREEIQRIGNLAGFRIGVVFQGDPEFAELGTQLKQQGAATPAVFVRPLNRDTIRGYSILADITNHPAGLIYLEKPRQVYLEANRIILGIALFSAGVFSLVTFAFFRVSQKLTLVSVHEYVAGQRLKTFIDLAVDGIFRLDDQCRILDVNVQAVALTGYQAAELVGASFDMLFSRDEIEQQPFDTERLQAGLVITVQRNLARKGGVSVPVEIRIKNLPDGTCQCIVQNRTEQAYWEGMLHQQQELLNGVINGTGDIIYAKDMDGRFILINESGLRFVGKKREEVLGLGYQDVFPPAAAAVIREADQRVLAAETVAESEDIIPLPGGADAVFLATRAPLRNRQGCITGLCAILHDVTVRTMLERELLNQHNRMGQLAVSLSLAEEKERVRIAEELHDQVGPTLLSGKMKLNMLQSRLSDEGQIAACEDVDGLLAQAVKDIRSLTLQLRPPILANAGLEAALKWLAQEYNQKYGLQVDFSDDGQQKTLQYEKRTILFQAVRELLLNAVKHARCSVASIAVQRIGPDVRIVVTDNGIGFKPGADAVGLQPSGGFGLFNITRKLSYIHGRLAIDTAVASGANVVIEAPLDL